MFQRAYKKQLSYARYSSLHLLIVFVKPFEQQLIFQPRVDPTYDNVTHVADKEPISKRI